MLAVETADSSSIRFFLLGRQVLRGLNAGLIVPIGLQKAIVLVVFQLVELVQIFVLEPVIVGSVSSFEECLLNDRGW